MTPWLSFLLFALLAILVQGIFTLFEMASVSFNKMRLQYYASLGQRRAIWLTQLLKNPSRLFGTTLIGVNAALQIGSECARRFYEGIGLDPDFAPLTQVILVVIFAELAPLFAARRHPEQLALFFAPLMNLISYLLTPFIWGFDALSSAIQWMIGKPKSAERYFSRDEVQKAFEEEEESKGDFNIVVRKIFQMKNLTARMAMTQIQTIQSTSSIGTVAQVRQIVSTRFVPFIPVFHNQPQNIVAIAYLSDLLRLDPNQKILDAARPPWFVTQETSLLQILDQFRRNNQTVAVILDPSGRACGILTLDQIIDEVFGPESKALTQPVREQLYVERTVSASMTVDEFNQKFHAHLPLDQGETLSDLIVSLLRHPPVKGESLELGQYELTVLEPTLRGVKLLSVQTKED